MIVTISYTHNYEMRIEVEAESIEDAVLKDKNGEYAVAWSKAEGDIGDLTYVSYEDEDGNTKDFCV